MKQKVTVLLYLAFVFILPACHMPAHTRTDGIQIEDMLGRKVSVPQQVERVVGLRAGTLRLLTYMDAADKVCGIEEGEKRSSRPYLTAYPGLTELTPVGPLMGGDAEAILNARPDVIFTAYTTAGDADDLQKKTGIPVVALECSEIGTPAARDSLYSSLRLIGKILHKEDRAHTLITYMESEIEELNRRTRDISEDERPTAYVGGIAYGGVKDIASTQPFYPPFVFTHAKNVASVLDGRRISHVKGTYIDKEQLLIWNPDVIFIDEYGLQLALNDLKPGGAISGHLKAVNNNKVFTLLPYNNYATNYELVLIDSWFTGKVLYPDAFPDIDITEKADEILTMFYGKPIFNQLITDHSLRQIDKNEIQ